MKKQIIINSCADCPLLFTSFSCKDLRYTHVGEYVMNKTIPRECRLEDYDEKG